MQKQRVLLVCTIVVVGLSILLGCAGMPKPSESNFINPTVALSHVEIPYYVGYYYFANSVTPTQGKAGDYGSAMQVAFVFDIHNPNVYPVELDGFRFTVMFEEFEVNTVSSQELMWIPPGKTNQLRVPAMFDTRQTLLTLLLPGALLLKEKEATPWQLLEKWWTQAPDFAFEMAAAQGSAIFRADGITRVSAFEESFP